MPAEPPRLRSITPEQMRDARKLLRMSRERLAVISEATASFIQSYENTGLVMKMSSREASFDGLASIRATFESAGVSFTNGKKPAVKLKRPSA